MGMKKVAIMGLGLIGASIALAMRKRNLCSEISGFGRTKANLIRAKRKKIIDSFSLDPAAASMDSDIVILATPVGYFTDILSRIRGTLKRGAIVTDVGSVKGGIVDALESETPDGVFFVGAHPIAGSERSGIDFASADLFRDALCILTPTENTDTASLKTIESLWKKIGAKVMKFSPHEHDGIFSSVSHMPHVAAYALVSSVDEINPEYMSFAGQGFKDATRIALSSPEMWVDICRFNKDNIAHHLDVLIQNLNTVKRFLKKNDFESLGEYFSRAKKSRESLE
jgi:prephenate dehydrogenase